MRQRVRVLVTLLFCTLCGVQVLVAQSRGLLSAIVPATAAGSRFVDVVAGPAPAAGAYAEAAPAGPESFSALPGAQSCSLLIPPSAYAEASFAGPEPCGEGSFNLSPAAADSVIRGLRIVPQSELRQHSAPKLCADSSALVFEEVLRETSGLTEKSDPVSIGFPFRNVSDRDILITRMTPNCSCISLSIPSMLVRAGESSVITAVYNPKGHPGKFLSRIFVYTACSEKQPAAVLSIASEVGWSEDRQREFPCTCGSLRLRRVRAELSGPGRQSVSIRCLNGGTEPLRIGAQTAFLPSGSVFECSPELLLPGQEGVLTIRFDSTGMRPGDYPLVLTGTGAKPSDSTITINIR